MIICTYLDIKINDTAFLRRENWILEKVKLLIEMLTKLEKEFEDSGINYELC